MHETTRKKIKAIAAFLRREADNDQIELLARSDLIVDLGGLRGWSLTDVGEETIACILLALIRHQS